ncbi:hypothetical protein [Paenibacillus apiarius]|uniref:hypothetical protein n=1 Tax=Paenibacillus apiarius TaxID=46240 RepID=UPI00197D8AA5|nr:hypothetical protein [Paenibacillus apiarius]MBN3525188.1 hypothetical protein [Paenibacillus apiarius]
MHLDNRPVKVISGLLAASRHFEYQRLPELYCGHGAELGEPVPYPSTCSPQAWSAGTAVAFVQAILGLDPNVPGGEIRINPMLPEGIGELTVERLRIGAGELSLKVTRLREGADEVGVEVLGNTTGLAIVQSGAVE